jgi:putative ABC transport system permease protein
MRLADAAYRVLLLAFPRHMRCDFGREMRRLFLEELDAARGVRARVGLWVAAIGDAVTHGGAERAAPLVRAARVARTAPRRWRWWMAALLQDLRYGARLLVRHRALTAIAVLTLAIGIGANTALFSAVDAVLLRPLPYPEPDRLVMVWEKRAAEGVMDNVVSPADYLDWARLNGVFSSIAAYAPATADLTGYGEPVRIGAGDVSPAFFDVFGVAPALGRTFRPEEAVPGRHRVVILSDAAWRSRFGADPAVVGRTIQLNGVSWDVIGVLPRTFEFPDKTIELWSPLAIEGGEAQPRASHFLSVYARLKPGITLAQARAEMDGIGARLEQEHADTNRGHGAWVTPMQEHVVESVRAGLLLLLGAVAFVLLIACANIANLLLARAASRTREMAVRGAVGASRARLLGQALTESVLLALLGGCAGLVVARWAIGVLPRLVPEDAPLIGLDRLALDTRVLLFALAVSIATGLFFGLIPAWQMSRLDVNDGLKDSARSATGVKRRLRASLVVMEIALASLLLVGAGLTLRSFNTLLSSDAGFSTDDVLTATVTLPAARYRDAEQQVAAFQAMEARLAAIPGVRSVGATSHLPLSGADGRRGITVEGREPVQDTPTRAHIRSILPGYFRTMGITLVAGRPFGAPDNARALDVVIVNQTMARRYWPGTSPLGRRVRLNGDERWRQVVGIVQDVRHWGLDRVVNPEMYLPEAQYTSTTMNFVLQSAEDPQALVAAVRGGVRAVDPNLPVSMVRSMEDVAAASLGARRIVLVLIAAFAVLALVLAAAGIYGVMSHLVALRTAEIGVRMSLGADGRNILGLVIREGMLQAAAGLALGMSAGVLLMSSLRAWLYSVSPFDPLTLATVAVVLLLTATLACAAPARRAMRVDPIEALRNR